jgi:hypothetical protein
MVATGMMVIYCIQSYKLCYNVRHHRVLESIASGLKKLHLLVISLTSQLLLSPSLDVLSSLV